MKEKLGALIKRQKVNIDRLTVIRIKVSTILFVNRKLRSSFLCRLYLTLHKLKLLHTEKYESE